MKHYLKYITSSTLFVLLTVSGCTDKYLDIKRDHSLSIPATVADFQAILDDGSRTMMHTSHELSVLSTDEYYIADNVLENLGEQYRYQGNAYLWLADLFDQEQSDDWNRAYRRILFANSALEGIENIDRIADNAAEWDAVKGSALFYRAFNHYQVAQLFCAPYKFGGPNDSPGIPVKRSPELYEQTSRGTVEETYQAVLSDLHAALELLPAFAARKTRPSKHAAAAMLARVYLQMQDYERSGHFADRCLRMRDELIDFNRINVSASGPFPSYNPEGNAEIIFFAQQAIPYLIRTYAYVDTVLLRSYEADDLRQRAYFGVRSGRPTFKGSYVGAGTTGAYFTGIAVNEIVLIRAECNARQGMPDLALQDINRLLRNRYISGKYQEKQDDGAGDLLGWILHERKKELIFNGLRWDDLRRLNLDATRSVPLERQLGDRKYVLKPSSSRYIMPIPENVIRLGRLQQNERSE